MTAPLTAADLESALRQLGAYGCSVQLLPVAGVALGLYMPAPLGFPVVVTGQGSDIGTAFEDARKKLS